MQDRRVQRGNTYAAMVIPAGTNPDTMVMEKKQNDTRKRTFKSTLKVSGSGNSTISRFPLRHYVTFWFCCALVGV